MGGTDLNDMIFHNALPVDRRVNGYEIQLVLGQSGLSITYLALSGFQKLLAVEEFFPNQLATRSSDDSVHPTSNSAAEAYTRELKNFIAETNTLAQLRQASIPRVYPALELNNTAYRAMDYERGKSLQTVLNQGGIEGEKSILDILMPLLDGVAQIHLAGLVHGGIRPDNIVLRKIGPPLLHGFGSAQSALAEGNEQGPWTDIYALAACFFPAIAGHVTPDYQSRARALVANKPDPLKPATELGADRYSRPFLAAIERALSFLPEERPQSITEWRALLNGDEAFIAVAPPCPPAPEETTPAIPASESIDPVSAREETEECELDEVDGVDGVDQEADEVDEEVAEQAAADDVNEVAELPEALKTADTDEIIVATPRPPQREEAGLAAKRVLDKARAAAEQAAIERARRDAESAAFRRSNRRWIAATVLFIATAAGSIGVFYRQTYTPLERPGNDAPRSAATPSADKKEASELDLSSLLDSAHCVSAAAVIANGSIYLTGYSARQSATTSLISALKQKTGIDRIQNNIADVSADKCGLLETYRSAWRSNQGSQPGATLSTRNPGNVFRDEERVIIDLTTSDYPSHLYIDFFLLDGTVLHMIPSAFNPDNQAPAHYEATIGELGDWAAAPPYGEEIVVMLSSSLPLFKNQRLEHENTDSYLAALSRELKRASKKPDTRITASFLLVNTRSAD